MSEYKKSWKPYVILVGMILSFVMAIDNIMSGIYIAVVTNTFCNYIVISRQRSKTTTIRKKKERSLTVDEFRDKEMEAFPHRPYPRHNPHEFTD
mgnify:CR=1 FL=1|tara:strand:+ start:66 stop:347 length:282 start_codon:yes stop_codon:yes gene_type:complete